MYNPTEVFKQCQESLRRIEVPISDKVKVTISSRLSKCFGYTKYDYLNNNFTIVIAEFLLDEENPLLALQSTIIHELIHTCDLCQNHGPIFKTYAQRVNTLLGIPIFVKVTRDSLGIKKYYSEAKYAVGCPSCGEVFYFSRMINVVKHPESFQCCKCKTRLERIK